MYYSWSVQCVSVCPGLTDIQRARLDTSGAQRNDTANETMRAMRSTMTDCRGDRTERVSE